MWKDLVAANSVQLIINAAAYTAVDKAETEEALAFRVNAQSVASVARAAQRMGARLVHVSTDYGVRWHQGGAVPDG